MGHCGQQLPPKAGKRRSVARRKGNALKQREREKETLKIYIIKCKSKLSYVQLFMVPIYCCFIPPQLVASPGSQQKGQQPEAEGQAGRLHGQAQKTPTFFFLGLQHKIFGTGRR